ncbi:MULTISPECIES: Rne/Rng family ribonuclease [Methylobacterium]|uniref:Ribonuclease E n=1 Tax=Methylobacterium longum TaxID=767694 RepID=A0ABT8ASB4_9HYPH|nr:MULTISPECIES: ribonuclease E/G [Methylobacterium]MCJ2099158.1 Rne/Rng family ribonuclease [Methylobacterium sp. E-046]MDN3572736.1 Rne/Rng family ribonuclease [Methylobacterium longum]GJE10140.1 Ribonuclease E [Methylobacterium longum]
MANKMLIDAMHPEETRVVTVHGSRVEEFDFEAANRRQLRGNIYLAKVTRVEPSLQAAFVEYGGNRHGFLAFNEIHPDYYQIPLADRQALLEEEARDAEEHREREERRRRSPRRSRGRRAEARARDTDETVSVEDTSEAPQADGRTDDQAPAEAGIAPAGMPDTLAENAEAVQEALASEAQAGDIAETRAARAPTDEAAGGPAPFGGQPEEAATDQDNPDEPEARIAVAEALTVSDMPEEAPEDASADARADAPADSAAEDVAEAPVADASTADVSDDVSDEDESEDEDSDDEDEDEDSDDEDEADEDSDEDSDDPDAEPRIAQIGGNGDALAEIPERPRHYRRQYKIQEVIKRRQIILVQVVKEERGTKGAALTTYLSLAGRYSVLMPNTGRGGGISRKITSAADRKRLKEVVQDLEVPEGMGVILRTAGASRSKPEIARDFEYLMRLWESVRELTLTSMAPALVYEEGSLIKRAIRDLYNKDLDEVLVAGEDAYREAKDFMRMLMPGQSKVVKPYRDATPIFARFGVEQQLDAMFSTHVSLKSGGYLVINPTEALVSIDVNSGRATREHDIEDTALKTNLEAAEEVARQLRLRDLAGLIVIDFIDMEEKRNNRAVEKKLNECLKNDRARIQVGRISPFGLMEMSRQRIRTGVLESSSIPCVHCGGSGFVRATASVALHILRSIEEALLKSSSHNLILRTRTEVALYILNQKRGHLRELELRFGVTITIAADEGLAVTAAFQLDRGEPAQRAEGPVTGVRAQAISPVTEFDDEDDEADEADAAEAEAETEVDAEGDAEEGHTEAREDGTREEGDGRRRRRRRRRRGGRPEGRAEDERQGGERPEEEDGEDSREDGRKDSPEDGRNDGWEGREPVAADGLAEIAVAAEARDSDEAVAGPDEAARTEDENGRRRRRGRRGGRGRGEGRTRDAAESEDVPEMAGDAVVLSAEEPVSAQAVAEAVEAAPSAARGETAVDLPVASEPDASTVDHAAETLAEPVADRAPEPVREPVAVVLTPPADPDRPKRAGWWSRTKAALTGE